MIEATSSRFRQVVGEALRSLHIGSVRGVLAGIGIVIGTAAVISVLHLGYNARQAALRQFSAMGTDVVLILPQQTDDQPALISVDDVRRMPSEHIGIKDAAAVTQSSVQVRANGSVVSVFLLAVTDHIYSIAGLHISEGRATYDLDERSPFVVAGHSVIEQLRSRQTNPEVGSLLSADDKYLNVVGLLQPAVTSMILNIDFNNSLIVPFDYAKIIAPQSQINAVAARLDRPSDVHQVVGKVKDYFAARMSAGTVSVLTAAQLISGIDEQMHIYDVLAFGIGLIAILVGGIGIMNVMLMNVLDRRREIGLRVALGARRFDILLLFLTESLVLSTIGTAVGCAAGYLAGWGFSASSEWPFEASPVALPLAICMALIVGLLFGIYPAMRAARLDPVAALRSE